MLTTLLCWRFVETPPFCSEIIELWIFVRITLMVLVESFCRYWAKCPLILEMGMKSGTVLMAGSGCMFFPLH